MFYKTLNKWLNSNTEVTEERIGELEAETMEVNLSNREKTAWKKKMNRAWGTYRTIAKDRSEDILIVYRNNGATFSPIFRGPH